MTGDCVFLQLIITTLLFFTECRLTVTNMCRPIMSREHALFYKFLEDFSTLLSSHKN